MKLARFKGLCTSQQDIIGRTIWESDLSTPLMVVSAPSLTHNIDLMASWCRDVGVELAPHAKTTMAPAIVDLQIQAGASGITVASVSQAMALDREDITILIANEVVDPGSISWMNAALRRGAALLTYIDSVDHVQLLRAGINDGVLDVLLEVGPIGGRAGVRSLNEALAVAEAAASSSNLRLVGISAFEGVMGGLQRSTESDALIAGFLRTFHGYGIELAARGLFQTDEVILSAGGSSYFDIVAEELGRPIGGKRARVIVRSGCYVTHDHGAIAALSPLSHTHLAFQPAITILGSVLSRPEPDLAICDVGRRDAPFDAGLPKPLWIRPAGTAQNRPLTGTTVSRLNDQHTYLEVGPESVSVGDLIGFGISHPCTAFDKWRLIPLVDDEWRILELIETRF
jgi:D-serine deaminase-like pyridoxal phosphate-dependent protein